MAKRKKINKRVERWKYVDTVRKINLRYDEMGLPWQWCFTVRVPEKLVGKSVRVTIEYP